MGTAAHHRPQKFITAAILLVVVVILGVTFNGEGAFFQWETHRDMLRQMSVYGILACGATIVIVSGRIDLAVGSILALCAVVFSILTIGKETSMLPAPRRTPTLKSLVLFLFAGLLACFHADLSRSQEPRWTIGMSQCNLGKPWRV